MKSKYLYTKTTVSLIRYHFVFCPRYRRKIFLVDGVEERFKQLTREICEKNGFEILAMECHIDHVHLFIACGPTWSPSDIMKTVKGASSLILRKEFPAGYPCILCVSPLRPAGKKNRSFQKGSLPWENFITSS